MADTMKGFAMLKISAGGFQCFRGALCLGGGTISGGIVFGGLAGGGKRLQAQGGCQREYKKQADSLSHN